MIQKSNICSYTKSLTKFFTSKEVWDNGFLMQIRRLAIYI